MNGSPSKRAQSRQAVLQLIGESEVRSPSALQNVVLENRSDLPLEIQHKLARQDDQRLAYWKDHRLYSLFGGGAAIAGLIAGLAVNEVSDTGFPFLPFVILLLVATVAAGICQLRLRRLPAHMTAKEQWEVRDKREKVDLSALRDDLRLRGTRAQEANLVVVTNRLIDDIRQSPAWHSDYLDTHRVRLNPEEEARQVARTAQELLLLRRRLVAPVAVNDDEPPSDRAQHRYATDRAALNQVWSALVDRVAALHSYRSHLNRLSPYLDELADRTSADAAIRADRVSDEIAKLVGGSVRDEMATAQVQGLSDEAGDLVSVISRVIGDLRGDLAELDAPRWPK